MQGQLLSGRYQIIAPLGRGGFGQTYLAADRQQAGHHQCVLKKLHPVSQGAGSLETARRLFEREADVLYKLGNHPQIPTLYTYFEEAGNFYLVLEFIDGKCLSEEFYHRSCTDEIQIVDWLKNILPVLGYIHRQNVIYRDIKPSNLIRRNSDHRIMLIDFGAVKEITTQMINRDSHTTFTIAIGSPGYIANEQMAGKPRFCSDIYSLGILCIQALTGLHPQQLPEDPRTSEIMWRDKANVSPGLADVLDKMVRYDFRERYVSAAEAKAALALLHQPTLATVPILQPAVNPPVPAPRKKPLKLLALLLVLLGSAGGGGVYLLNAFNSASANELYDRALTLYNLNRYEEALGVYEKALSIVPEYA